MLHYVERIREDRRLFGARGVAREVLWKLAGKPPMRIDAHPRPGVPPVHLRLGTSDVSSFKQVFVRGDYAIELRRPPRVIVDAGANVGLASVYFALRYPDARILALEPESSNHALLVDNVAPYPNVTPLRLALWDACTTLTVVDGGRGYWSYRTRPSDPDTRDGDAIEPVPAVTVERLLAEHRLAAIDLLKIDVEGAEYRVFRDPTAWIGKVAVIAAELHDWLHEGCSARFDRATREFEHRTVRHETTFVARAGWA